MTPDELGWATSTLAARQPFYRLWASYYDGQHRLAFATDRVRDAFGSLFHAFALNLCPAVVDTLADRLRIVGWSGPESGGEPPPDVQRIWERNLLPARHGRVHRDTLIHGDGYLGVWQDADGLVRVYDESPLEVVGKPDPERPGQLLWAAKVWREAKRVRVTFYYPDRVERWTSRGEQDRMPSQVSELRPLGPEDVEPGQDGAPEVPNGWGVVPVFHLANNPGHSGLGRSELADVVPLNDALNKTVADMLAAQESYALPLRYLIGVETENDPTTGKPKPIFKEDQNRVVTLPKDSEAGQWDAADLSKLLEAKREYASDIARVARIPMHVLMQVSGAEWPSGLALRTAEAGLVAKADDRVGDFGPPWAACMQLAARMAQGDPGELRTLWAPTATPPSPEEAARTAQLKQVAGIPRTVTWREMGYSEAQVQAMETEYQAEQGRRAEQEARTFAAGLAGGTGGL